MQSDEATRQWWEITDSMQVSYDDSIAGSTHPRGNWWRNRREALWAGVMAASRHVSGEEIQWQRPSGFTEESMHVVLQKRWSCVNGQSPIGR
jgi:hypothetical protein